MLGDTGDPYLGYINSSRAIRSHYDKDPMYYVSDPNAVWNVPFYPAVSVEGNVATAAAAESVTICGIFGRGDAAPFDAEEFQRIHPQWNWKEGCFYSRPSQPWILFEGESGPSVVSS